MQAAGFLFPDELHYDVADQVWARVDADGLVTVGVTALGAHLAGEMFMCRPKSPGVQVERGRGIAVTELAKSIVSVKSPVSGTVRAVNEALAARPERVHEDPYGEGWLARVEPSDLAADLAALLHGEPVAAAMAHHAWLHRTEGQDRLYDGEGTGP